MSLETQAHVCGVIWDTLNMAFHVAHRNQNLTEIVHKKIKNELDRIKGGDVTIVSHFFRNRYDYIEKLGYVKNGALIRMLRDVEANDRNILKNTPNLTRDKLKTFCQQVRELDPLVQNIRYYRNYFSHTLKENNQTGLNVAVISSIIRLCEIGLISKDTRDNNQENITKFKNALTAVVSVDRPTDSNDNQASPQRNAKPVAPSRHEFDSIIKEIKSSEQNLLEQIAKINATNITPTAHDPIKSKTTNVPTLDAHNIPDDDVTEQEQEQEQEQSNFVESITPEILRQDLKALSSKIKSQFENDRSFGASSNLLQIANIGEILQHEPQNLAHFLALPSVTSRTNLSSDTVTQQISDYGQKIDDLLQNVLWSSLFDNETL